MFNIRIYGLLIHNDKILLSDEVYGGHCFTKFPGGGLQFGESTIDCLKREMKEEYDWEIEVQQHFYTTDFFVKSIFNNESQVIAVYYFFKLKNESLLNFDSLQAIDNSGALRWKNISDLVSADVTFPIDKKVVELVLADMNLKSSAD